MEQPNFRYRIRFGKHGVLRFTGHLDLQRSWERTLRRARVPTAQTQGFHRRPRLQFAAALPLGFTSEDERLDVWLTEPRQPEQILAQLKPATPPGLDVLDVNLVTNKASLPTLLRFADYHIVIAAPVAELQPSISTVLGKTTLMRQRRDRHYDLRPRIQSITLEQNLLRMRLSLRPESVARPEEVLACLGLNSDELVIHRYSLLLAPDSPPSAPGVTDADPPE